MKKKTTTNAWFAISIAFIISTYFSSFIANQQGLLIEPICSELGMARSLYSVFLSVASVSTSILSLFFVKIQNKIGLKALTILGSMGAVGYCVFYVLGGMFPNAASIFFMLGQISFGCTLAWAMTTTSTALINNWAAKRRGTLISLVATTIGAFSVIASTVVAAWVISIGWVNSLYLRGAVSLIIVFLIVVFLKSKPGENDMRIWEDVEEIVKENENTTTETALPGYTMQELMRTKNLWFGIITTVGVGLFIYPPFLSMAANVSDLGYAANAGTVMSVCYVANIIVTFPMGGLMEKYGCRKIMLIMFALIIASVAIFSMDNISLPLIYVAAALMGVAYATFTVPVAMLAAEIAGPASAIQTQSYFYTAQTAGTILGAPLFNLIYDATGSYQSAFRIDIFCILLLCVTVVIATSKTTVKKAA